MAAARLSTQDKKDLDKFAKYLVYKCIQIIVQSRLGEKIHTQSKSFSNGSDWFNLGISDIPEVKTETIKVFNGNLALAQNVCIEISLKTAEGETMILETWWLTLTEQCDPTARVSYTIYNRMATLLKSLFTVSRATPSYRLARKQGPETFVICYRIYMGDPQMNHLGEGYEKCRVGGVPTPVGTFALSVAYRTKMLISPHTSTKDLCEDLQENHFNSECSPKKVSETRPCYTANRERRISGGDDGLMFGEPQDICATTFTSSPTDYTLFVGGAACGTTPPSNLSRHMARHSPPVQQSRQRKPSGDLDGEDNKENIHRVCAFAPYTETDLHVTDEEDEDEDVPFRSLLRPQSSNYDTSGGDTGTSGGRPSSSGNDTSQEDHRMSDTTSRSSTGSLSTDNRSTHSQASGPEDFVMVELKTPFAGPEGNSDLGRFYQECQVAPPLAMFQDTVTIQETLNSITEQLANFEASSALFDDFVDTLQVSEG